MDKTTTDLNAMWTRNDLIAASGAAAGSIEFYIKRAGVKPACLVGRTRLYDAESAARVLGIIASSRTATRTRRGGRSKDAGNAPA